MPSPRERVTFECLKAGQPRPYADSVREGVLTIERQGMEGYKNPDAPFVPRDTLAEFLVRRHAKAFIDWVEEGEGDWASPRLEFLKNLGDGKWHIKVVIPFTD